MERIGNEIERELARSGSRDAIPLAAVSAAWPEAVGEAVARKAWPLRIARDGTLHVATASATWAQELGLLQDEILGSLRAQLGDSAPSGVRFAVGPIPEPPAANQGVEQALERPLEVPPEIASEASAAAAEIDDPDLRELVARAARASLLRVRSGRHFW
jgi:predicted nucleic acid-binding Zn ribbon protein